MIVLIQMTDLNKMSETNQTDPALATGESLFTPQDEMIISDIETLRVLTDPLRLHILELLAEPHTVKEIAPKLAIGKTKLYYHINLLEKRGIIRVVSTRLVSGIVEKRYQVAALRFRPVKELFQGTDEGPELGLTLFDTIWDATRAQFTRSLQQGQIAGAAEAKGNKLMLSHTVVALTEEQAEAFSVRFEALMEELKQYETKAPSAQTRPYALTIAFFPKAEEERSTE